ncbi:MAG: DUF6537 domain-containing protein, partial [Solirubrobacteraceae bacterium]
VLGALRRIRRVTRREDELTLDAGALAERLFDDHMPANMILVGAALQHGVLPLDVASVERAIELNGAAVETNLAALRWGRATAVDPDAVRLALDGHGAEATTGVDGATLLTLDGAARALIEDCGPELRRILEARVPELRAWKDDSTAREYLEDVTRVAAVERERTGTTAVAEAYARGLFHLTAYKDEYEIARLHRDEIERHRTADAFGPRARVRVMLHPPLLRALGMRRKVALNGRWLFPAFGVLYGLRRLRGTPLDPFGHTRVRRLERALVPEYRTLVDRALERLTPHTVATVAEIAALAEVVRGYEAIKERNADEFRQRAGVSLGRLEVASSVTPYARRDGPPIAPAPRV